MKLGFVCLCQAVVSFSSCRPEVIHTASPVFECCGPSQTAGGPGGTCGVVAPAPHVNRASAAAGPSALVSVCIAMRNSGSPPPLRAAVLLMITTLPPPGRGSWRECESVSGRFPVGISGNWHCPWAHVQRRASGPRHHGCTPWPQAPQRLHERLQLESYT